MTAHAAEVQAEHWGLDAPVGILDPAQELETIELGDRVGWWLTVAHGCRIYPSPDDRVRSTLSMVVAQVAEATSRVGEDFPSEWWPADAGPVPVHVAGDGAR